MWITIDKDRGYFVTFKAIRDWVLIIRWAIKNVYLKAVFFVERVGKEIINNANKDVGQGGKRYNSGI